jgi:hypothetical protein
MEETKKDKAVLETVVVMLFFVVLAYAAGHLIGFNDALGGTFQDEQGRECISALMYRPTDNQVEQYGWEYGMFGENANRGAYIFCEVEPGEVGR